MASRNHRFASRVFGGVRTSAGTGSSPAPGSPGPNATRATPDSARTGTGAGAGGTTRSTGTRCSFWDGDDGALR